MDRRMPLEEEVQPRLFALARDEYEDEEDEGTERIVGYGLVLPNGSAVSVFWPPQRNRGTTFFTGSSAEQVADLRGADVRWLKHG